MRNLMITAAAATLGFAGAAAAQATATTTADLNIRSGAGSSNAVLGTIPQGGEVTVTGCVVESRWCQVNYNGIDGWAFADYMTVGGRPIVVAVNEEGQTLGIGVIEEPVGVQANAQPGTVLGALVTGPSGQTRAIVPSEELNAYVVANVPDNVSLDGEAVIGAGVPDSVQLYEIPGYDIRFARINEETVLVDPSDRTIVYVYR